VNASSFWQGLPQPSDAAASQAVETSGANQETDIFLMTGVCGLSSEFGSREFCAGDEKI
jgi:hypothetical protein